MNEVGKYLTGKEIRKTFHISNSTLQNWSSTGKISTIRIGGNETGKRLYLESDLDKVLPGYKKKEDIQRRKVCYARVSSQKQKGDLERQIELLKTSYPNYEIISDIGSGINWKRSGFNRLLDETMRGNIKKVVVAHRDRLCRFSFELVERVFRNAGCKIVVQDRNVLQNPESEETELRDDLLAIVTVFVASNNGKRAAAHRKERKRKIKESNKTETTTQTAEDEQRKPRKRRKTTRETQNDENENISKLESTTDFEIVVGNE
jgi:putative resolvase